MIIGSERISAEPVGSVMVVGGGVAGIQAALDLSASGYKVYLLETRSALGGHMAMLDKTFPTDDCSMCTMSPRLVSVAQDPNIEILTLTDLVRLEGKRGRFTATINLRPRFVDLDKCTGCGDCTTVCPVELDNEFNQGLDKRKAIDRLYPQAVPSTFVVERDQRPRCMLSCPIGTNPQGYIALIRQKRYHEALQTLRDSNPLPSVCGRVCHHPCELNCSRAAWDAPVSVMGLKRFLLDYCAANPPDAETRERLAASDVLAGRVRLPATGKSVAIVGCGPAGLTAADHLARKGHKVVVFEALSVPGGMLRVGIPDFRLPPDVLHRDIDAICEMGVEIRCNQQLGRDFTIDELKSRGFDAVLLAVGTHKPRWLGLDGEEAVNVLDGLQFLRDLNLGKTPELGERVVVIGGGNVAIDVARAAKRLGNPDVAILYRRTEVEMPALPEEVEHALQEQVRLEVLVAPESLVMDDETGLTKGLECIRMRLGEPDESGRCRPVPIPKTEFFVPAETIIVAVGQDMDEEALGGAVALDRRRMVVDVLTQATSAEGVFAAGDVVTGMQTVTGAMGQGRRAAISIDNYLAGRPVDTGHTDPHPPELPPLELDQIRRTGESSLRQTPPVLPADKRIGSFDEVNLVMDEATALIEAGRCLSCGLCSDCRQCVRVCEADAIRLDEPMRTRQVEIGGVILASGYDLYDARRRGEYGYGRYPNVVTSLQFERLLSSSGPTGGKVFRPGDGKEAHRVAFIQCVGSRDDSERGNEYCSGVCCMYATKAAMNAKAHSTDLETSIFIIDMRAHGKGYERYYLRAQEAGVRYVRSMVSAVRQDFATGDLLVDYVAEDGTSFDETFDMVVLSVGLEARCDANALTDMLDLEQEQYRFVQAGEESPVCTSRDGVMVCGTATGPKDIPDSVTEASAAAALLGRDLSSVRSTCTIVQEFPPERDVSQEPPRVGVFICHCGNNIAGVVEVPDLESYARELPNVAHVEHNLYTCSPDGLAKIVESIQNQKLNRVVVAACTPRTHTMIFQQAMQKAGINKYLFEMTNIRDQCSWVHAFDPVEALEKAKDLVASSVAKAARLVPLREEIQPVQHAALIIGGGLAGMVAADNLAGQGFHVDLVEKTDVLGGQLQHVRHTLDGLDVQELLKHFVEAVGADDRITVHLNSTVTEQSGSVGNFESTISSASQKLAVRHGVTIVAAGAEMHQPEEYGFGTSAKVVTQRDLERMMGEGLDESVRTVVMIQCVGCRNDERPYCSRICCGEVVKNALELKRLREDCQVVVLYKDVRTFGKMEKHYLEARRRGVLFIRYEDEGKPDVGPDGTVSIMDLSLGRMRTFQADLVALSAAVVAPPENRLLSEALRLPVTLDGFFMEAHVKLRPVDFASEGVFLAGMAHSPKFIHETITQSLAAAGRAAAILSKETLVASGNVATVESELCAACLTCVRVCPYSVPQIEDGVAVIEPTACQGCGTCAAECPAGAICLQGFTSDQVHAAVAGLFRQGRHELRKETTGT